MIFLSTNLRNDRHSFLASPVTGHSLPLFTHFGRLREWLLCQSGIYITECHEILAWSSLNNSLSCHNSVAEKGVAISLPAATRSHFPRPTELRMIMARHGNKSDSCSAKGLNPSCEKCGAPVLFAKFELRARNKSAFPRFPPFI